MYYVYKFINNKTDAFFVVYYKFSQFLRDSRYSTVFSSSFILSNGLTPNEHINSK